MDEARHASCGGQHIGGAGDIAGDEAGFIGRVHHPGDVQHGRRALAQAGQRVCIIKIAQHPFNAGLRRLRPAGEGAHGAIGERHDAAADEAGGAGKGDRGERAGRGDFGHRLARR